MLKFDLDNIYYHIFTPKFKNIIMRINLMFLICVFITACSMGGNVDNVTPLVPYTKLVYNSDVIYKYYELYQLELNDGGTIIPNGVFGIKYLLVDEGLTVGPNLKEFNEESVIDKDKGYILFSSELLRDEKMVKASMYRQLTILLDLGITPSDSKIMLERTTEYDYSKITNKDYQQLLDLIKKRMCDKYIQITVPM